jgi:hypothetical protein
LEQLLPLITGSSGALVVLALGLWLFIRGKIHSHAEYEKLEQAYDNSQAANRALLDALAVTGHAVHETAQTGQVTQQLIQAFTQIAQESSHRRRRPPGELTAEDLGLS